MPAVLNNAIDWASRPFGEGAIKGKPLAVVGTAVGQYGGQWAHDDTRKSARVAGAAVVEEIPSRTATRGGDAAPTADVAHRIDLASSRRLRRRRLGEPSPPDLSRREPPSRTTSGVAELHDLTALEQGALIRTGEIVAVELTDHYLDRRATGSTSSARSSPRPRPGPRAGAPRCRPVGDGPPCRACRPRSRT